MKRAALIAAVCILTGMVLTTAVAWGCWLNPWKGPRSAQLLIGGRVEGRWEHDASLGPGVDRQDQFFPDWPAPEPATGLMTKRGNWRSSYRCLAGAPARALASLPSSGREVGPPWIPLWPGFAIDTVLYGSLAAALWFGPGLRRRSRRRRRGLCIRCGYSRTGLTPSAACPECGTVPYSLRGRPSSVAALRTPRQAPGRREGGWG